MDSTPTARFDLVKVNRLRCRIARGKYEVEGAAVAERLLLVHLLREARRPDREDEGRREQSGE